MFWVLGGTASHGKEVMSLALPVTLSHFILALTAAGVELAVAPDDGSARYVASGMYRNYAVTIIWENDGYESVHVRNILHVPSNFRSMSASAAQQYIGL